MNQHLSPLTARLPQVRHTTPFKRTKALLTSILIGILVLTGFLMTLEQSPVLAISNQSTSENNSSYAPVSDPSTRANTLQNTPLSLNKLPVSMAEDMTITQNTTWSEDFHTFNRLIITNSATLTLIGSTTITASQIIIAPGSGISANETGYPKGQIYGGGSSGWRNGGHHGGQGGLINTPPRPLYGNLYAPVDWGSGGDGGAGGGAIHLIVSDLLVISGTLSANGAYGPPEGFSGHGGGAGGSIWLEVEGTLTGDGTISAKGGNGSSDFGHQGGAGGGGRIAIYASNNQFLANGGTISVAPGVRYYQAEPGTIYLDSVDPATSTLVATPTSLTGNGQATSFVTVTLKTASGIPVPGRTVELGITPYPGTILNGQSVIGSHTIIGTSNSNGVVTATLRATQTGARILTARTTQGETISQTVTVTFTPGPADPTNSNVTVIGSARAAADGQDAIVVQVAARDQLGNAVLGITTTLTVTPAVTVTTLYSVTSAQGYALYELRYNNPAQVVVAAAIQNMPISNTLLVTFEGADLSLSKSGPVEVTTGYPLTYTLEVKNEGLLAATQVVITDTLPEWTTFVTQTSAYSYTYNPVAHTVVWQVGTLPAGERETFLLQTQVAAVAPPDTTITNVLSGTLAETELDTNDNFATVNTLMIPPEPNLVVTPRFPTLVVSPGLTSTLVVTITNDGTGVMTGTIVTAPLHIPWVTITPTVLGNLAPGETVTFTVMADAATITQTGYYRDRITVSTQDAGHSDIYFTVQVRNPLRDLQLNLTNTLSEPVAYADVVLVETIFVVTEGVTSTETSHHQGITNDQGRYTFTGLETEKIYGYTIAAAHHQSLSGSVELLPGSEAQQWFVVLDGQGALAVTPISVTFELLPGHIAQEPLLLQNIGAGPLSDITLTGQDIPFMYLGQLPVGTVLPAGQNIAVTVNVAPFLTETIDIYNGSVLVTASNGQSQNIPVTVILQDQISRTLCIHVETDLGTILPDREVVLTDLAGQVVATGNTTETIQLQQTAITDSQGQACFEYLSPGPYHVEVGYGEQLLGSKDVSVVPGETEQHETVIVGEPSLTVNWSVTRDPFLDVYTTTMILTFIPHGQPRLFLSPDRINLCGDTDGVISQTFTVHNFFPVTLTNAVIDVESFGNVSAHLSTVDGTQSGIPLSLGMIPPNSHVPFNVRASLNSLQCSGDQGLIYMTATADYGHFGPNGWFGLFGNATQAPIGGIQPGQITQIPLKLTNIGYPEGSNENGIPPALEDITLTPPQLLTWMTVEPMTIATLPVSSEVDIDLP